MTTRRFVGSSEIHALDTEQIVCALARNEVEYVLVGGLAALAYGSTMATADVDVLPRPDPHNLDRLLRALHELGAMILVSEQQLAMEAGEVWAATELNTKGAAALAAAAARHFTTSAGPIDVVLTVTGVGPYDAHVKNAQERAAFGARILIAAIDDLIASKEATRRPKDEAILRELRQLESNDDES